MLSSFPALPGPKPLDISTHGHWCDHQFHLSPGLSCYSCNIGCYAGYHGAPPYTAAACLHLAPKARSAGTSTHSPSPPLMSFYPPTSNMLRIFSAAAVASRSFSRSPNSPCTLSSQSQEIVPCLQALAHWARCSLCSSLANELQWSGSLPWDRPSLPSSLSP